jgi:hypothetical protein
MRTCLLGQAHTRPRCRWLEPVNDSREWLRVLGGGDVLNYQRALTQLGSLEQYDVAIVELTPATHRLPELLKRRLPDLFVLGLVEGRVEYVVRSREEMEGLYGFCQSVDSADMLGILVERTLPYYRLYLRAPERAQWLGVPYPKDWTDRQPHLEPKQRSLVIELGSAMDSRNGIANLLVLRDLQRRYPQVLGRVYRYSEREQQMIVALGIRAEFRQPCRWRDYFLGLSDVFAILCLDDRRTWGRYALDAAAARIPYVGSHLSHCGERVAVLSCDPFDTSAAVAWLERLVEEHLAGRDDFYQEVTERQYQALEDYDGPSALKRLRAALDAAGYAKLAGELVNSAQAARISA